MEAAVCMSILMYIFAYSGYRSSNFYVPDGSHFVTHMLISLLGDAAELFTSQIK